MGMTHRVLQRVPPCTALIQHRKSEGPHRGKNPRSRSRTIGGQMTVELAVAFPVLVIIAVIAVNALTFFSECALFDRAAHNAIRAHAAAPAYGQSSAQSCALVEQSLRSQLDSDNLQITVSHGVTDADFDEYTATLAFYPTLFGMGLRSEIFGVALPHLTHTTRYVVDSYKPGVII